jgi:long-chain acyl-CoA synthetase
MNASLNTLNKRIADATRTYSQKPALSTKVAKEWKTYTYGDVAGQVRLFSLGLRALGVERGDRVAMLSENRPEWAIADLAALAAGAVTVPIYPTLPPSQVLHILQDSGAKAIVVSDAKQLHKVEAARDSCPNLSIFVAMDESSAKGDILSFDAVVKEGETAGATLAESFEERRDSVQPSDLMSFVYTSGTTGNPKGAMLTHGNFVAALDGIQKALPVTPGGETFLSFLPLCHVFERVVYCLSLSIGAQTYYNDSIFKLVDNLTEVRPTILQCVPRVFESIHERVNEAVSKQPKNQQDLVHWALGVGDAVATRRNAGQGVSPLLLLMQAIADKLVLQKMRARFGGRIKFFVSGGAPLNPTTAHFFNALGIPVLEGWGLTETTAASTINPLGRAKVGTVGKAGFGAEVKTAEDGELLVRGPHVMQGYWNLPEATAEVIDSEGWFHTGDIGEIDSEGYIKITDRKKDILVLGNGKKVAPQPIEVNIKRNPYIAEVVLIADQTGNVSALVVPQYDKLKQWAKEQGKEDVSSAALATDPAAKKFIKSQIEKSSGELADFEKVKRVALLEKPLSVEEGELTPTLKVRRRVVTEKYGKLLERE